MSETHEEQPRAATEEADATPESPTPEKEVAASSAADETPPQADEAGPGGEPAASGEDAAREAPPELLAAAEEAPIAAAAPVEEEPVPPAGEGAETGEAVAAETPDTVAADPAAPHAPEVEATAPTVEGEGKPAAEATPAGVPGGDETPAEEPAPEDRATTAAAAGGASPEAAEPKGDPRLVALRRAKNSGEPVEGKVFGWNQGGFHVVVGDVPAFCPRSEMELGEPADPDSYVDKTFTFRVLRIQGQGRRIVLSRTSILRQERDHARSESLQRIETGAVLKGQVTNLTDFGAFVDLGGGVEGLVHVSEISHQRVEKAADVLTAGQEVEVKVLKVEKGGKRISLSMRALQSDPWQGVKERYPEGTLVTGRVERTGKPGAFIELEPGLTGLLPVSEMGLPREAIPARVYPPGKEVKVLVVQVDPRRRRVALALEGSAVEGSRTDYVKFKEAQQESGFGALAAAFQKIRKKGE